MKKEVEKEDDVLAKAEVVDDGVAKEEDVDEKPTVKAKATRKRKTKEEVEMVPLRARTQGLRMCVGAHVSAAKGLLFFFFNASCLGSNTHEIL